ncbi:TPA: hypothetical protein DCQ44_01635, partial [Candidatus Taylorbacteria bacterium]|nr:hypothetical protein [Candidatus Taylorbacteria bacterium]
YKRQALYLLLSWLFATYPKPLAVFCRVAIVVIMIGGLTWQVVSANTPAKENYREAAQYLDDHATTQDIIAITSPFTIYPVEYYYRGNAELATLPIWNRLKFGPIPTFNEQTMPQEIATLKDAHQKLWLLQSYDQGYQEKMRIYFDTHFQRLNATEFSHNLILYEYRLRYD